MATAAVACFRRWEPHLESGNAEVIPRHPQNSSCNKRDVTGNNKMDELKHPALLGIQGKVKEFE
jgi:hypothetical protein